MTSAADGARPPRHGEEVDVCIVGAGPSGSVAARYLAEAGFSVVTLEQGDWPDAAEFPGDKPEFELVAQKQWHPNPNVRDRDRDYPINTDDSAINPLMYAAVGGSTTLYAGHWTPFMPSDFRVRTLDGIADDWPFTYEDLLPNLEAMERVVGVSGLPGNPAYPPRRAFPTPPLPIGKCGMKAAEGMDKLGWHWWPGTNAMPSRALQRAQSLRTARHLHDRVPGGRKIHRQHHALAPCAQGRRAHRRRRQGARDHL